MSMLPDQDTVILRPQPKNPPAKPLPERADWACDNPVPRLRRVAPGFFAW